MVWRQAQSQSDSERGLCTEDQRSQFSLWDSGLSAAVEHLFFPAFACKLILLPGLPPIILAGVLILFIPVPVILIVFLSPLRLCRAKEFLCFSSSDVIFRFAVIIRMMNCSEAANCSDAGRRAPTLTRTTGRFGQQSC